MSEKSQSVYITSDTHFSHPKIIPYCDRPFKDIDEMNEILINNWNSVVGPNDIVKHLGDFAMGNKDHIKYLVSKLNGKIDLIMGNHDRKHSTQFYLDCGFNKVYDSSIVYRDCILCHKPILFDTPPSGINILFGHTHNSITEWPENYYNVCVEMNEYKPINFEKILKYFRSQKI